MRFHSQNLNEKSYNRTGSMIRHGRCWWKILKSEWRVEWSLFCSSGIGVGIDLADYDEDAVGGHIALGYIGSLYWGFHNRWLRKIMERVTSREDKPCVTHRNIQTPQGIIQEPIYYWSTNGRNIGIKWFEGLLWINLWNDPMEHRSVDPWWWDISICPVDVLFGRTHYEENRLTNERVVVPMPEGGYDATVEIFESVWRRPRWPWAWRRMIRSTITPDTPIPFPGKGESEWDCGEDATHSMTGAHDTAFNAALALSESVMRSRVRYGGWKYQPEGMRS